MQPNEAAAQGRIANIPMIIGYNAAGAPLLCHFTIHTQFCAHFAASPSDAQLFVACSDKQIPLVE
jgi:hypothetical protein